MPLIGQAALGNQHADGYTAEYYAPSTHKKSKQVIKKKQFKGIVDEY